jgi:DNA-binding HxlR family transcriptional regulator
LAANTVNGSGNGARSGAQTLVLLAAPLNSLILAALADGPRQLGELQRETGSPAQTTLRAQLKRLVEIGTIEKHRRNRFPGALEYELTRAGRDLLIVVSAVQAWLERSPGGPLTLGEGPAKAAIKALAESWSTTMVRVLAAGPLSLTELDGVIVPLSYPALERRLAAMRLAGLIEACRGNGRGTPYGVSTWLRHGVAPLAAAARWERRHRSHASSPIARLDAEAAFLLAVPLLRLQPDLSGTCRAAIEIPNGDESRLAGVTIAVERGRIASCTTRLAVDADAWALGPASAWLEAVIERDDDRLELGGDGRLAAALLDGLHTALFGGAVGHAPIEP